MKNKILVMFSGGLDSTYMLHLALTEDKYKDYDIEAHHINIVNFTNRAQAETLACNNIVNYMTESPIYRGFEYSTSTIAIPHKVNTQVMQDMYSYTFVGAYMSKDNPAIVEIQIGRTLTDSDSTTHMNYAALDAPMDALVSSISLAKRALPIVNFSKKNIWDNMPKDLRNLTWSCRVPRYDQNKVPMPCGICKTCKELKDLDT